MLSPTWHIKWVNPQRIEAGEALVPAKLQSDITREMLLRATDHIQRVIVSATSQLDKLRLEVYAEFKAAFDKDKKMGDGANRPIFGPKGYRESANPKITFTQSLKKLLIKMRHL